MTETSTTAPLCKICGTRSVFFDRCDFHANAKLHRGLYSLAAAPSGHTLDYYRCPSCGFMFTTFMDQWSGDQFATFVYNKDYPIIDGSYNGYRAGGLANMLYLGFHDQLGELDFLDYGGGVGIQSVLLRAFGARRSETFDPFAAKAIRPEGPFHVVTALEVLEHSINPRQTVADWVSFTGESSLILFTTEIQPQDIHEQKTQWWYVAPRVGHVSIQTNESLRLLFAEHGFQLYHPRSYLHIAFRNYPIWASNFIPQELLDNL